MSAAYLDASAIVKLVVPETGSVELERDLRGRRLVSSALSRVEVIRAVARRTAPSSRTPDEVLDALTTLAVDEAVLRIASTLAPARLRTLDAIHLASALQLGSDVDAFVTYDRQLADAAAAAGLRVESPG